MIRRTAVGLIAVALLAVPIGSVSSAGSASAATISAAGTKVDRKISDGRITESSGLAPSLLHPGVLWTHNDSGNPPRIYAIGPNGSTAAALTLRGEPDVDWEAIASFRAPADSITPGAALIAVGDIGDNNAVRGSVRIAIVREPERLSSGPVSPIRVLRLRYPGGPRDAEALLADPRTGHLYVVSKTLFGSTLYSVPRSIWPGGGGGVSRVTTMTRVATMGASFVTDGAFLPNGLILLRGYTSLSVLQAPSAVQDGRLRTLANQSLPDQDQGESIAVMDGGSRALIGSEGRREPVLRVSLPAIARSQRLPKTKVALPKSPDSGRSNEARPSGPNGQVADPAPAFTGVGDLRIWTAVLGGGLLISVLTLTALTLRTRRRF